MNQRIEDAKKKLRSAFVDLALEEMEIVGDSKIAVALLFRELTEIVESLTLEEFTESLQKGGAK